MTKGLKLLVFVLVVSLGIAPAGVIAQQFDDDDTPLSRLWDQVHAQPNDFGVACMPVDDPSGMVLYNETEVFPLASVSKLLVLLEYARRVDDGTLTLSEMVPLDDLNRYDVPATNSGAHDRFLEEYPTDITSISLWAIAAKGMVQYSSNAAADYMLARLQPMDWGSLYDSLGLTNTGYPMYFGVIAMLMGNHETGQVTLADVPSLSVEQAETDFDLYLTDDSWRAAEITYHSARQQVPSDWEAQALILQKYTVTGTPQDWLKIMEAIYGANSPLSDRVKQLARSALRWDNNEYIDGMYTEYGSKLGFYSGGTLTLVAYGQPLYGRPVISVTFFRNLPRPIYRQMRQDDSIGELAHWMNFNVCTGLVEAINQSY
jgi:hypothetical protein